MRDWILQLIALLIILLACSSKADENRVKIAIVDTGLNIDKYSQWICKEPASKDFSDTTIEDNHGHGTNIFSLITQDLNPKNYCVIILKWENFKAIKIELFAYSFSMDNSYTTYWNKDIILMNYLKAMNYLFNNKVDYLNLSLGGNDYNEFEQATLQKLLKQGTKISVAAGNNKRDLEKTCNYYPACNNYKESNFYVIGSRNENDDILRFSNYNGPIDYYDLGEDQGIEIVMTGTSQAAANFTNKLVKMGKK